MEIVIILRDRNESAWIIKETKIQDTLEVIKKLKWRWVGCIAKRKVNRWSSRLFCVIR